MEPPTIYLPEAAVEPMRADPAAGQPAGPRPAALRAAADRGRATRSSCRASWWSPSRPRAHTVPSLGFVVWQRRRKLKPEFQGLPGEQIRDLRLGGTEVTARGPHPAAGLPGRQLARRASTPARPCTQAEVLIMELTFVAPSHRKDKIHKFGHMHLDDFLERRDRFQNELIIASHFSTRYHRQPDPPARRAGPARHARRPAALVAVGMRGEG